jgi:transcriptional regulator with XRE-family HTH domain
LDSLRDNYLAVVKERGAAMSKVSFGKWIKEQRREQNLTAEECARRVSAVFPPKADGSDAITRSGWSWYEKYTNKGRVDPETIKKVAIGLGLDETIVAAAAPQYVEEPTPHELWRLRLGQYLRQGREGKYTQEELSWRTGLSRGAIGQYETGAIEPSLGALRTLLIELGLSADAALEMPSAGGLPEAQGRPTEADWRGRIETRMEEMMSLLRKLNDEE